MKVKVNPERGLFDNLSPFAKVLRGSTRLWKPGSFSVHSVLFKQHSYYDVRNSGTEQESPSILQFVTLFSTDFLSESSLLRIFRGIQSQCQGFLNQYILYSCVVIGQFIVFAIFWFLILTFLSYPSNQIEFGQRYFRNKSEQYIKDLMNCSDDQNIDDSYEKLNRFQSAYKCCGWNGSHDYNEMLNITEVMDCARNRRHLIPQSCCVNSSKTCEFGEKTVESCSEALNKLPIFSYFHKSIYFSLIFLFLLNIAAIYVWVEISSYKAKKSFHRQRMIL